MRFLQSSGSRHSTFDSRLAPGHRAGRLSGLHGLPGDDSYNGFRRLLPGQRAFPGSFTQRRGYRPRASSGRAMARGRARVHAPSAARNRRRRNAASPRRCRWGGELRVSRRHGPATGAAKYQLGGNAPASGWLPRVRGAPPARWRVALGSGVARPTEGRPSPAVVQFPGRSWPCFNTMKLPEAHFRSVAARHKRRGSAILVVLVLLAVMSAIVIANTHTLHALKRELQLLDQRQNQRLHATTGH